MRVLFVAILIFTSFLSSIFVQLFSSSTAHAATAAEISYCVSTFPKGSTAATAGGYAKGFDTHHCGDVCKTTTVDRTGITTVDSCDPNTVASDAAVQQSAATDKIIVDGYAKAVCGSDAACIAKASPCITAYLKNGYEGSDAPVYPEVNIDGFSDCVAKATGQPAKDVYTKLTNAQPQVTKDAGASNNSSLKTTCEKNGNTWDDTTKTCVLAEDACKTNGGTWNATDKKCDGPKGKTNCSPDIGAVGWIVCPVLSFMATINDKMFEIISGLLEFPGSTLNTSGNSPNSAIYNSWKAFRNYANVAFIVVFLIIIFSQVSNVGINNYGIKRMLPKLLIAAILVNISFYVCAIMVDLSNLLGAGLVELFKGLKPAGVKSIGWADVTSKILAGTALGALAAGAVVVGVLSEGVMGLIALLAPILLAAVIALVMILIILVARWSFLVLLIVVSPLAFVAYLLPNTEQWFKRWWKMFSSLLFLYPVVAAVFGACSLASAILVAMGGWWVVVALGVQAIPLFAVPTLLKGALAATGSIGAKMQGWGNKATGRIGSRAKENYNKSNFAMARKIREQGQEKYRRSQLGTRVGAGSRILSGVGLTKSQQYGQHHLATSAQSQASKDEREAVDDEMVSMQKQSGWTEANRLDMAQREFVSAMRSGNGTRARAAQQILLSGGNKGISNLQSGYSQLGHNEDGSAMSGEAYSSMMGQASSQKVLSDLNSAGIKGKNAALSAMAYSEHANADGTANTVDSIAANAGTYSALTDAELVGQNETNLQQSGITSERAQGVMNNANVWQNLSENKKAIIRDFAV